MTGVGGYPTRMVDSSDKIGTRLRALRSKLDKSQAEMAQALGISQPQWSQYESGARRITLDVAAAIAMYYGVTLDWVYFGDPAGLPMRHEDLAKRRSENQ